MTKVYQRESRPASTHASQGCRFSAGDCVLIDHYGIHQATIVAEVLHSLFGPLVDVELADGQAVRLVRERVVTVKRRAVAA